MKSVVRILTDAQMEKIHDAAVNLLADSGMKIQNEKILGFLEKQGAKIDHAVQRAFLTKEIVARIVPQKPTSMEDWELGTPDADSLSVWGSHPFVVDWPECRKRMATRSDLTEALHAAHSLQEVASVAPPLAMSEVPPAMEPMEATALTMLTTDKRLLPSDFQMPQQIKYLARLSEIHTGVPKSAALISSPEYFTSPLTFGSRSAECLLEKARYDFPSCTGTMATSGLNSPGTVAGTVALALAELIGGLVIGHAVNPELKWESIACTGALDMATGNACFSAPECTLQDMALYQIMRRMYGRRICVAECYIDSPTPGIQATFEKTYRFCAAAAFGAHIQLNNGILEAGLAFSGLQCCVDLETNRALLRMYRGFEVNDDTIAEELIRDACRRDSPNFLSEEHTARHCCDNFWYPKLPLRACGKDGLDWQEYNARILRQADERWKDSARSYRPIEVPDDKRREIEKVLEDARKELLS